MPSSSKSSPPNKEAAAAPEQLQHIISYTFDGQRNDSHIQPTTTTTNFEYDLIIIGMGPSAIGLLHHLLTTSSSSSSRRHSLPPSYRIAIIERGDGGGDYFTNNKSSKTSSSSSPPVNSSSSSSLNQWFESSHSPTSLHNDIHLTLPQRKLHNRILELPCGRGLGGGSLINAGLVIPPEQDDFEMMRDDDDCWPGVWRGGERIRMACDRLVRFVTERRRREDDDGDYWDEFSACEEYLSVCGGRDVGGIEKMTNATTTTTTMTTTSGDGSSSTLSFVSSFMTSSTSRRDPHCPNRRCDYFTSLIRPLLDDGCRRRDDDAATVPSVTFFLYTQAERILFNDDDDDDDDDLTATGVEVTQTHPLAANNQKSILFTLTATHRIILCGGAILSPALLLVSGIGTPSSSSSLSFPHPPPIAPRVVASNPHVGRHLRDHVLLPRAFFTPSGNRLKRRRLSRNGIQSWYRGTTISKKEGRDEQVWKMQYHLGDGTDSEFAIAHMLASLCHRGVVVVAAHHHPWSHNDTLRRRLSRLVARTLTITSRYIFLTVRRLLIYLFRNAPFVRYIINHHTTTLLTCLLNPRSTGYVTIRPRRRDDDDDDDATMLRLSDVDIVVDPCYLTHPSDCKMIEAAWSTSTFIAQRHFSSSSFFVEILPSFLVTNPRKHLMLYAKEFLTSYYHYCGSCAMGLVVDEYCRVLRGDDDDDDDDDDDGEKRRRRTTTTTSGGDFVKGLMVCDASVFPSCVAVPTALTCAGLGYVVGGLLLLERD